MSLRIMFGTTGRILRQLRHDRRTIALMLVVPPVLLTLMRYMFNDARLGGIGPIQGPRIFDQVGLIMLGVFPFFIMFLLTSIAMLRERTTGTLERMLTTPVHKMDLLFGYGIAFAFAAALQAVIASTVAYWLLSLKTDGSAWAVGGIAVANAILGMALGLFVSAFAHTEFQAVQFMPAIVVPQMLLCGLIWPRGQMAGWLEAISNVMPMSYSVEALQEVAKHTSATGLMWRDMAIVVGCIVVALVAGAATLRRRTG